MRKSVYDLVRLPPLVVDALITVAIAVVVIVFPAFLQRLLGVYPLASSALYSLLLTAPLVLRRLRPVLSFALVSMVCFLQLWVIARPLWGDVAILVALSSIARYGPTWARWVGLAAGLLGAVLGPAAVDRRARRHQPPQ